MYLGRIRVRTASIGSNVVHLRLRRLEGAHFSRVLSDPGHLSVVVILFPSLALQQGIHHRPPEKMLLLTLRFATVVQVVVVPVALMSVPNHSVVLQPSYTVGQKLVVGLLFAVTHSVLRMAVPGKLLFSLQVIHRAAVAWAEDHL